ncbi:uncharacterized protein LOC134838531 [Culicoides brevitarsis]|uniref:uncharacterized protein LOC134838531 n=1 Tax=Culicoides brevitarsis TaxID=469753 RepID=UPI00307C241E
MPKILLFIAFSTFYITYVNSHGMLMDPVNRASRWRFNESAPKNYDDAGLWCGGFQIQHQVHDGKCGMCGDSYGAATPRKHELGGVFGEGVIVKKYEADQVVTVTVKVTVNHLGHFYFDLCNLDESGVETEECFTELLTADGHRNWVVPSPLAKDYEVALKLPKESCRHCVMRWTYVAGNNWGICEDGTGALGCGPQEHFRTCSDIEIVEKWDDEIPESSETNEI